MKKTKRILASLLTVVMLLSCVALPASATPNPAVVSYSRQTATEGIVMLKNDESVLPLGNKVLSMFGRCQFDTFHCGTGSGGSVVRPYSISIMEGLRKNPGIRLNEELVSLYEQWCTENPANIGAWDSRLHLDEMPVDEETVQAAAEQSDVAAVVIGRFAGEGHEATLSKGSYYLTSDEENLLAMVNKHFDKVIVLLNVGNVIDMGWVNNYSNIKSVLYVWQGGIEMGDAVADVLSGDVSPSGKLSDTIAKKYQDYPCVGTHIFGSSDYDNYVEDIYVGYRYFETFAQDKVMYPFGFGLSYTSFAIDATTEIEGDIVTVTAKVTNTGSTYSGKEVVEIYYGAPQGQLGKPVKQLVGYAKTNEIAPGASETVSVSFNVEKVASYDDSGKTGHKSAWVLEAGDYLIYAGNSVRNTQVAGVWKLDELRVVEQLEEANAIEAGKGFDRMLPQDNGDGTYSVAWEAAPEETADADLAARVLANLPEAVEMTGNKGYKLIDVYTRKCTMDEFIAQLTPAQLGDISRGSGPMGASPGTPGNASVFAGTTQELRDYGIPYISTCDGPSGIRLSTDASLVPIGTLQACTWNNELIERLYQQIGVEMNINEVECLLGPGMNIHRNPLCGRNFEYFSEDPILTGLMASAVVRGLQSQGVAATPKHYALNNQEVSRNTMDSRASERAQREIYLRGFEICVKTAKPYNLMTSYNKINGEWGHYNYDTVTTILRNDWGYTGVVETDWWMQSATSTQLGNVKDSAYRIRGQIDVLMPGDGVGGSNDTILNAYNAWVDAGQPTDRLVGLTLGELQRGARNVLNFAMESRIFRDWYDLPNTYVEGEDWFVTTGGEWVEKPLLTGLTIRGMDRFNAFSPSVNSYQVFVREMNGVYPEVQATAEDGAEILIEQATAEVPTATITVLKDGGKNIYRVTFTDKAGLAPVVSDPALARVTSIKVNGYYIDEFYPTTYHYTLKYGNAKDAEIELVAADGVETVVTRDLEKNMVVVRAMTDDQAVEYTISFPEKKQLAVSDDFDDANFTADAWKILNPTPGNISFVDGKLVVHTADGEWYGSAANIRNVYYQNGSGSYTATVKLTIPTPAKLSGLGYYQFGMTVFDDPDNFVDLMYVTTPTNPEQQMLQIRTETAAKNQDRVFDDDEEFYQKKLTPKTEDWASKEAVDLWLRIKKTGDHYAFAFKTEQTAEFVDFGYFDQVFTEPKIGIFATNGNNNRPPVDVKFDDFTVERSDMLQGDDFEDGTISGIWQVDKRVDAQISEEEGYLKIQTGASEWYGTGTGKNEIENVFHQSAKGNWTATTEMVIPNPGTLAGKNVYQFGVAVFDDPDNYVDFLYTTTAWTRQMLQVRREENGSCNDTISNGYAELKNLPVTENWGGKESVKVWLRVQKEGNTYTCSILTEEMKAAGKDFAVMGVTTLELDNPQFGFYASHGNNNAPSITVKFGEVVIDAYDPNVEVLPTPATPILISATEQTKVMGSDAVYTHGRISTETCTDPEAPGLNLKYTEPGLYYLNLIQVEQAGWYQLESRYSCGNAGDLLQLNHVISLDGDMLASFTPGTTGGWQTWEYTAPKLVYLPAGRHTLRVDFNETLNVNFLRLTPAPEISYSLRYEANAEDEVRNLPASETAKSVQESYDFTVSEAIPTRTGYLFAGWTLDPATNVLAGNTVTATKENPDVTLYAVWTACAHEGASCVDNGNGTHTIICDKCGVTATENHTYVDHFCTGCAAEEPHFTVYYTSRGNEANRVYMSECDENGFYSFTEQVAQHEGYLYGGVFTDNTYMEESLYTFNAGENGIRFQPVAEETYYVKEIEDIFFRIKVLNTYRDGNVLNIYLFAALEGDYQDENKNIQGINGIGFLEAKADGGVDFPTYHVKKSSAYYNSVTLTIGGQKHKVMAKVLNENMKDSDKIFYYALGSAFVRQNRNGEQHNLIPYFVTCDGVLVTGTTMSTFAIVDGNPNLEFAADTEVGSHVYALTELPNY